MLHTSQVLQDDHHLNPEEVMVLQVLFLVPRSQKKQEAMPFRVVSSAVRHTDLDGES